MQIETLKIVCFSPTGTTKAVATSIANGIVCEKTELTDITKPNARTKPLNVLANDLLIVAVPVYMGRVPDIISEWLHGIKAEHTPAVCVVVYGNRTYENALLELSDILTACGCNVVAGAAFVGEHSFSDKDYPCSTGRPNASDINRADYFGFKINEMLQKNARGFKNQNLTIPGNFPYGGVTKLWKTDFISVNDLCNQCGFCASLCPTGAIDKEKSHIIDSEKCTICCACIKKCPQNARGKKPGLVLDAAIRINNLYSIPKEPELFL